MTDTWVLSETGSRPVPNDVARRFPHLFEILGCEGDETYVADTTFECQLYGDQTVNYEYFVTKNNITTQYNGGVYCPPGDTANSYINY